MYPRGHYGVTLGTFRPATIGQIGDVSAVGVAVVVLMGLVGLFLAYVGWRNINRAYSIWTNDPIAAESVYLASGVVELEGEAEPIGEILNAKYTGTNCVAYKYKKKKKRRRRDKDGNRKTEWTTVDSGEATRPFYVTDETGEVAVDPDDAALSLRSQRVGGSGRIKKYEGRLEPGDTVHVYGQKLHDASDGDAPGDESVYVGAGDEAPAFTVSDTTETWTIVRFAAKGVLTSFFAAIVLGIVALSILGGIA